MYCNVVPNLIILVNVFFLQFLTLPTFQKRGLGSRLLNAIYKNYLQNDKVVDITGKNIMIIAVLNFLDYSQNNCVKIVPQTRRYNIMLFCKLFAMQQMSQNPCSAVQFAYTSWKQRNIYSDISVQKNVQFIVRLVASN